MDASPHEDLPEPASKEDRILETLASATMEDSLDIEYAMSKNANNHVNAGFGNERKGSGDGIFLVPTEVYARDAQEATENEIFR